MLADLWEEKLVITEELRRILKGRVERASRDHHAKRPPRPCGITIHTGIGCSYGCVYCYVPDMGFPMKPKPYPLEPLEMTYALAINPYVIPRRTLTAFGSVTEPFLKETQERALSYIKEIRRWLKLPIQISTKSVLVDNIIDSVLSSDKNANILISVSVIGKHARILEPNAPSPEERIESARRAIKRGLKVTLFMRPIIPMVTDAQATQILELAWKAGIREVVLGTLRVTRGILLRLKAVGLYDVLSEVKKRIPRQPKDDRDQVTIRGTDLKRSIEKQAKRIGFKVLPSSCSANILSHGEYCEACRMGPCGNPEAKVKDPVREASELLEVMGFKKYSVEYDKGVLIVNLSSISKKVNLRTLLEVGLRVRVKVVTGGF